MSREERPFEGKLRVLEKNPLVTYGALAMLVGGPLLFVGGIHRNVAGVLGLYMAIAGLALLILERRSRLRPIRRWSNVRADREGIWLAGRLFAPRSRISHGYFQPLGSSSTVRIFDKHRRLLLEAETEEAGALDILRALGLDAASKRAQFMGASPLHRDLSWSMALRVGSLVVALALAALLKVGAGATLLMLVPLVVISALPSQIIVGVDGIYLRWLVWKRFIPMSQIRDVSPEDGHRIRIWLADGRTELLYTSGGRQRGGAKGRQHRDAVLARIEEAIAAYRTRQPTADVSALLVRGSRSRTEWLDALAEMGSSENGYRQACVREDDLWRVVENPTAAEDARAAAALLLRPSLDEGGKSRVRIAAEATASPKLRVALEAAAQEDNESDVAAALEALAGEDAARAVADE